MVVVNVHVYTVHVHAWCYMSLWARHFTIIASLHPGVNGYLWGQSWLLRLISPMRRNGSNWAVYFPGSWDGFRNFLLFPINSDNSFRLCTFHSCSMWNFCLCGFNNSSRCFDCTDLQILPSVKIHHLLSPPNNDLQDLIQDSITGPRVPEELPSDLSSEPSSVSSSPRKRRMGNSNANHDFAHKDRNYVHVMTDTYEMSTSNNNKKNSNAQVNAKTSQGSRDITTKTDDITTTSADITVQDGYILRQRVAVLYRSQVVTLWSPPESSLHVHWAAVQRRPQTCYM